MVKNVGGLDCPSPALKARLEGKGRPWNCCAFRFELFRWILDGFRPIELVEFAMELSGEVLPCLFSGLKPLTQVQARHEREREALRGTKMVFPCSFI